MPSAGRLGDKSSAPSDSHGCKSCAHTVIGPSNSGSPDVLINSRSAMRVNDTGTHSSCCGPNTWSAVAGSANVLINGRAAHRLGDSTQHCGGAGQLVEGSPDVIIGDEPQEMSYERKPYDQAFVLIDTHTGEPLSNVPYRLFMDNMMVATGKTDSSGRTSVIASNFPTTIRIEVVEDD